MLEPARAATEYSVAEYDAPLYWSWYRSTQKPVNEEPVVVSCTEKGMAAVAWPVMSVLGLDGFV